MLQVVGEYFPVQAKEIVMEWISGPEGLRVIDVYLEDKNFKFPRPTRFEKIYKVIEIGLRSHVKNESENAACTLQRLLFSADWDDTFELYDQFHGLMTLLCVQIEKYWHEEATTKFNQAAIFLLDTYDEAVLDYARAGLANTASFLIQSPIRENYTDGLEMMRLLTQVD